jgi:hypothetical protein
VWNVPYIEADITLCVFFQIIFREKEAQITISGPEKAWRSAVKFPLSFFPGTLKVMLTIEGIVVKEETCISMETKLIRLPGLYVLSRSGNGEGQCCWRHEL